MEKYNPPALAWNGRPIKSTDEQIASILMPMFDTYPSAKRNDNMVDMYVKMLRDIDPVSLAQAVLQAMAGSEFLPTIAAIRKAHEETKRAPGPSSQSETSQRRFAPSKTFRLDPEEDKRQRMERLRQTRHWGDKYA
jgi:hypothetical protein